jgi:hypothetical protein
MYGQGFANVTTGASSLYSTADSIFGFNRKRNKADNKEMMDYSYALGQKGAREDFRRSKAFGAIQHGWNKEMLGWSTDANKDLMKYQQDYNSPKATAERLREAGMSVGLMMGQGGGTSGTGSASTGGTPSGNTSPSSRPNAPSMPESLYGKLQLEGLKTSIEGMKIVNDIKRIEMEKKINEEEIQQAKVKTRIDKDFAHSMADVMYRIAEYDESIKDKEHAIIEEKARVIKNMTAAELDHAVQESKKSKSEAEIKELESKWKTAVDKYGLNPELVKMAALLGNTVSNILTTKTKSIKNIKNIKQNVDMTRGK